jgi:hypothetical protein
LGDERAGSAGIRLANLKDVKLPRRARNWRQSLETVLELRASESLKEREPQPG